MLRAGAGVTVLPTPLGVPMMGYGARTGVAESVHDPLHARALYLADAEAGTELLLVSCELCLMAPSQADALRGRIHAATGVAPEQVLIGCIHTHSGPDTGLGALITERPLPQHVAPLFDAVLQAARRAQAAAEPARLGVGHARAAIGRNRRIQDGPLDPDVLVVRVDRLAGEPLAVLFVHGCHPTALGHENLAYSADWPGAALRSVAEAFPGALPLFALGAHADVDPRTRDLLDLAIPGQSAGVSHAEAEALGREVGRAVVEAAAAIETHADARVAAGSLRLPLRVHPGSASAEERERRLGELRADALAALGVPDDPSYGTQDFYRLERERTAGFPLDERRLRAARVRHFLRERTAPHFAGGVEPQVEVQLLRLGPALLLGLPLEACVDVGLDWKQRMAQRGCADAAVLSIANGWLRYLPHPRNFAEPGAELKYEILQSTFPADAATRLLDAGEALADSLEAGAPGLESAAGQEAAR